MKIAADSEIVNVERDVIGLLLARPELLDSVTEHIKSPSYFSSPQLREIFAAISDLGVNDEAIEVNTVAAELDKRGKLKKIGGRTALTDYMQGAVSASNISANCRLIVESYRRRVISDELNKLTRTDPALESAEIINRLELLLTKLQAPQTYELETLGSLATEFGEEQQRGLQGEYLETRIVELNRAITGLFKGDLTIVAAPPSMGKTSFCLDLCLYNAALGKRSIYFAIDETRRAIVQRGIANYTGFRPSCNYSESARQEELKKISEGIKAISQRDSVYVCDRAGLSALDIRSIVRRVKRQDGLDLVVIDYIQQVRGHRKYERRDLEVGDISTTLKEIAKENNIAMVAVSQLNREYSQSDINPKGGKFGFPRPSQLRDSGVVEQDANLILFPYNVIEAIRKRGWTEGNRAYDYEAAQNLQHGAERSFIIIAKNKIGPTGNVECLFNPRRMLFYNWNK